MKPKNTVADIFNAFGKEYLQNNDISYDQLKVMTDIQDCRTENLGGHWKACDSCGNLERHYNSCGNRHCPSCQGINKEKWILERKYDLLPVKYFHVVFTVPSELRSLFSQNKKLLYDLLFKASWDTLQEFALDKRQNMEASLGAIAILHTWTQKLIYHPHIHFIVPEGGISHDKKWKVSKGSEDFLFYVPNLANKFRGKFLDRLYKLFLDNELQLNGKLKEIRSKNKFYNFKDKLYQKKWVINCKKPFNGPDSVLEYLGRYTHRIAISNYRIININKKDKTVTFSYLDRSDNDKKKSITLSAEKFIARFLQHVLPKGYTKIRHYGFLASRIKTERLKDIRKILDAEDPGIKPKLTIGEVLKITYGIDPTLCKACKEGIMIVVKTIPKIRGQPTEFLIAS